MFVAQQVYRLSIYSDLHKASFCSSPAATSLWECQWRHHLTVLQVLRQLLPVEIHEAKTYREYVQEYNLAMVFTSMGMEIKLPPGKGTYLFLIHRFTI
jgi:hypothetical protein